jgi:hypothetical protein
VLCHYEHLVQVSGWFEAAVLTAAHHGSMRVAVCTDGGRLGSGGIAVATVGLGRHALHICAVSCMLVQVAGVAINPAVAPAAVAVAIYQGGV